VQLLVQIDQVKAAISGMFGDTVRGLTLTTLDPRDKADFLLREANSLTAQLQTEKDPARIQALANRINQDITEAFGLLDPEEQRRRLAEFTNYANEVNTFITDHLNEIGTDVRNSASDILTLVKDAFAIAVDNFVIAAAAQNAAANTQLDAANTPIRVEVNVSGGNVAVNG
jgi:outer membrane murein-binding lipoprotein Lpp